MRDWATLPLRLGLGVMFLAHGLQKAFGMLGGSGIEGFSQMLSSLGFAPAVPFAYLVAYIELLGGLFLILGLFTRVSSVMLVMVMIVAMFKVHFSNGFFGMNGGYEYNFIIILSCLSLLISGPGHLSICKKY